MYFGFVICKSYDCKFDRYNSFLAQFGFNNFARGRFNNRIHYILYTSFSFPILSISKKSFKSVKFSLDMYSALHVYRCILSARPRNFRQYNELLPHLHAYQTVSLKLFGDLNNDVQERRRSRIISEFEVFEQFFQNCIATRMGKN